MASIAPWRNHPQSPLDQMQPQDNSSHLRRCATRVIESCIQALVIAIIGCVCCLATNRNLALILYRTLKSFGWYISLLEVGGAFDTLLDRRLFSYISKVGWLARHERRHITAGQLFHPRHIPL